MNILTDDQDLAVRKHCIKALRDVGVRSLNDLEPHKMEWGDLQKTAKRMVTASRDALDKIGDKTPEQERKQIESVADGVMEVLDAIELEKDIRTAEGSREPRAQQDSQAQIAKRPECQGEARGVDDGGGTGTIETADRMLDTGSEARDKFRVAAQARNSHEYRGLTLGRYFRAMTTGAKTDVERRALSEGSDSAGGYTVPEYLGGALIDALRAQSVCVRAGAQTMPLTSNVNNVAKLTADPTPGWRDELAAIAESDPTFGNVALNPKSLAVKCSVSHELLSDSLNLERELPRVMAAALATELDRVALLGSGTAPEPEGIANVSGIGTVAQDAVSTSYINLSKARTAILSGNAGPVTAYVLHPRDEGKFADLIDGDGQPLRMNPKLEEIPMLTTTAIPTDGGTGSDESTIFAGNFRHLIMGIREDIRIEVLRHTLATDLSYTFIAHMRADVAVQHASAFYTITGVQA